MDQEDLAIFRQVEAWMTDHAGYPTVSGHDEFLYEPDKPLRGDLSEFAYQQRGAIAYAIELWDLFARIGMPRPPKFVQYYERVTRHDLVKLAWWDRDENESRIFPKWRPFAHPQLGPVEIGGIDPRFGMWNPPPHELPKVCLNQASVLLRVAAMAPRVRITKLDRKPLESPGSAGARSDAERRGVSNESPGSAGARSDAERRGVSNDGVLTRVDVRVENDGYLATYGMPSAKKLEFNEPLYATCTARGCELVDVGAAHQVLGHLDGWGHGLHTGANLPSYPGTRGTTNAAWASYLVRGKGVLDVRIGGARVGFVTARIEV
jgi:hypothetical protein